MESRRAVRTAKIGYILLSAALCVLGLLLIVIPGISLQLLGYVGAAWLFAFGIIKLVGYFSKDLYSLAFQHDLAFGILLLILAVVILVNPIRLTDFYCIILGLFILGDALLKIQTAVDAKKFGLSSWWLIMALAILAGALGFSLILRPSSSGEILMCLLGVNLLAEGILNLVTVLTAVKLMHKSHKDIIDYQEKGGF